VIVVGTGAAGQPNVFRFNGTSWGAENIGAVSALESAFGVSSNDIFVVGLGGRHQNNFQDAFFNYGADGWIRSSASTFGSYTDVWAPSGSTVYVSSASTLVYRGTKN
jgi:hypothetical protein